MSLLTIIQRTCGSLGLPQPAAAFASTDRQTVQLIEHLYEEGESLLNAHDWSWGITAKTFTFIAGNPQTGEPPSAFHRMAAPGDGEFIVWNDSNNTPIIGPLSAQSVDGIPGPRRHGIPAILAHHRWSPQCLFICCRCYRTLRIYLEKLDTRLRGWC